MLPKHQTKFSAGADLTASESVEIQPGETVLVGTGFKLSHYHEHSNMVYMLFIRSSLSFKRGLSLTNGVGVIDADYKDEIKVMLTNHSKEPQCIVKGERIAQIVPMRYVQGFFEVEENERNGGFGSTNE
jgi:dUTP pyrophosphatase